jgi:hypothetical protein
MADGSNTKGLCHICHGWLSDEVIYTLIRHGAGDPGPSPLRVAEVRHAGGAIAQVDPKSGAYGNREASHIVQMVGVAPPGWAEEQKTTGQRHRLVRRPVRWGRWRAVDEESGV